jgi:pimeloyl-ACP methyl ester carboxylesterase
MDLREDKMSEEIVTFGGTRSLVGILHRPGSAALRSDLPAVLLLNAGILHRVGPNRLYVNIARKLEQQGFHVLRFDVWGIGDSQDRTGIRESTTFYDDALEAMELLRRRLGVDRFMLMGICMGAKIALGVAERDPRAESLILMEGIYVKSARYHVSRMLDPEKWRRILTGESYVVHEARRRIGRLMKAGPGASKPTTTGGAASTIHLEEDSGRKMGQTLRALLDRGAKIMMVFRDGNEIAYNYRLRRVGDDISAVGLPPGMDVTFVRYADHTFTPLVSQELLLGVVMRWIKDAYPNVDTSPVALAT